LASDVGGTKFREGGAQENQFKGWRGDLCGVGSCFEIRLVFSLGEFGQMVIRSTMNWNLARRHWFRSSRTCVSDRVTSVNVTLKRENLALVRDDQFEK
jgi:hypothetical protein